MAKENLNNFKLETLLKMVIMKERMIKVGNGDLTKNKARIEELTPFIKIKQTERGLSDEELSKLKEELREEGIRNEGVCPLVNTKRFILK